MDKAWKVVLAFVGIFAAGGVTGGLIALRVASARASTAAAVETTPPATPSATANNTQTSGVGNVTTTHPAGAEPARAAAQAPEQLGPQLFRRFTNQLGLTQEQRQKIRPIEVRSIEEINRVRRDSVHSVQLLIDKTEDDIRAVLTSEQAAKFDVMVAAQHDRIEKFAVEFQKRQREQREKMLQPNKAGNVIAVPAAVPAGADESKK